MPLSPKSSQTLQRHRARGNGERSAVGAIDEELARLERGIAALPRALREVLVLRAIEGLSQAETADALGVTEKAVETRLYRARAKLADVRDSGR